MREQALERKKRFLLACVASVFVGFGSKERPRNGIFGVFRARKMGREPKNERGGWGRGTKERRHERSSRRFSKSRGLWVCLQAFPSSPSLSLSFLFLALAPFFARAKHRKSRFSDFLCSLTPRKRLLRRLGF